MSDAKYIACIDAVTTGCRTIIFSSQGIPVSQAYEEYRSIFISPTWIDHDPVTWIQAAHNTFKQALREFLGDPADIAAIGVISQRATFIPVDADGSPLDHAILFQTLIENHGYKPGIQYMQAEIVPADPKLALACL